MRSKTKVMKLEKALEKIEKERILAKTKFFSPAEVEGIRQSIINIRSYFKKVGYPYPPLSPQTREILKGYMSEEEMAGHPDYDPEKDEVRKVLMEIEKRVDEMEERGEL